MQMDLKLCCKAKLCCVIKQQDFLFKGASFFYSRTSLTEHVNIERSEMIAFYGISTVSLQIVTSDENCVFEHVFVAFCC